MEGHIRDEVDRLVEPGERRHVFLLRVPGEDAFQSFCNAVVLLAGGGRQELEVDIDSLLRVRLLVQAKLSPGDEVMLAASGVVELSGGVPGIAQLVAAGIGRAERAGVPIHQDGIEVEVSMGEGRDPLRP